ncbi:tRNA-specific adenosine deaminase 2 [Bonamia ostreae]|uniref:tRNA-specific adenosine deaminase 2 n=1 Tax=Bonamia ostreae TaxID=126728 RepID=A0ABV2AHU2_9EUKA
MAYEEKYMEMAFKEAERSLKNGEVPVGCVVVKRKFGIWTGHNRTNELENATAHSEIQVLQSIKKSLNSEFEEAVTGSSWYITCCFFQRRRTLHNVRVCTEGFEAEKHLFCVHE